MNFARAALIGVGVSSVLLALLGLIYNMMSLRADFSALQGQVDAPYFYPAFYIMSAICIVCYFALLYIGVQLMRGRTNVVLLLVLVVVFEILYSFAVGSLWLLPDYGMSIAAATGVANGGLMIQAFLLFPLWAPVVAFFASRSLQTKQERSSAPNLGELRSPGRKTDNTLHKK